LVLFDIKKKKPVRPGQIKAPHDENLDKLFETKKVATKGYDF